MNDTIAAVATPFGEGALAVVRMSGPRALAIAGSVLQSKTGAPTLRPRVQTLARFVTCDGQPVDDVLATYFRAPASYTGEDVVEFSCHGGILVTRRVFETLIAAGARTAEPGEFTRRAFLNGRIDLTQAEAVMDLIRAQTDLALRAAHEQLAGGLGQRVDALRQQVLDLLAHIEACIDFPDEDIPPATSAALLRGLDAVLGQVGALLRTAGQGRLLREGVRTVIAGAPNVGKSSLLNLLLGFERAIVSETPGTTRDTIEEVIALRGIPLRLIDTAGLRHTEDHVEREGIRRAERDIARADLVLRLWDGSQPPPPDPSASGLSARDIPLLNKSDLGEHPGWAGFDALRISCRTGAGLEALGQAIFERVMGGVTQTGDHVIAINSRHQTALREAAGFLEAAAQAVRKGVSPEFIAIELRAALDALGGIVGKTDVEELLDRVFGTFCIGK